MRIGWPWAVRTLKHYEPKDEPASEKEEWDEDVDVRCPSYRSKDILFEELVETPNSASPKYNWTCSVCGHEWQDDGVATKRKDDHVGQAGPTFPHSCPIDEYILMYILSNGGGSLWHRYP